ncbi:hypothetical protein EVAR_53321_1 [Eumeta japonica]|uniref:Uncharacterized protein n=1 Tax=Eumeta variegata TaxID=151549 RepID=A0A4C1XA91_EUMVA|nr:hypothetical protein EVAR_53321_1 [Eumeta japonica]
MQNVNDCSNRRRTLITEAAEKFICAAERFFGSPRFREPGRFLAARAHAHDGKQKIDLHIQKYFPADLPSVEIYALLASARDCARADIECMPSSCASTDPTFDVDLPHPRFRIRDGIERETFIAIETRIGIELTTDGEGDRYRRRGRRRSEPPRFRDLCKLNIFTWTTFKRKLITIS